MDLNHPERFSCGHGMAAREDGEKQVAFRKLHAMLTVATEHEHVYSEGGMWAWQVTCRVHFLVIPP